MALLSYSFAPAHLPKVTYRRPVIVSKEVLQSRRNMHIWDKYYAEVRF